MDQDYVDNYIKKQLSNHETQIDNDLLWAAIEQKKSKNPINAFGIIGMFLLASIIGLSVWMFNQNSSSEISHIGIVNSSDNNTQNDINEIDSNKSTLSNSEIDNSSKESLLVTNDNKESTLDISASNNDEPFAKMDIRSTNKSTSNFSTKSNTITSNSALNNSTLINSNNSNSSVAYDTYNNGKSKSVNLSNSKNTSQFNNNNNFYNSNSSQDGIGQNDNIKPRNAFTIISSENALGAIPENNLDVAIASRSLSNLPLLNQNIFSPTSSQSLFPSRQPSDCPTFGKKKHNIYLQAYTFFDFVNNNFSTTIENQNYLNERERTQSYLPSFRAGLQAKYVFDNGIYIKGGIEYGQVRDLYKDRIVDTLVTIEADQLISYFETSPGDTTFIYGNAPVTTISAQNWRVKNSYKSIDIPILVGYQIKKSKLTYGIEMGVINNIKFTSNAFILDVTGTPRFANDYFTDNIKLSLTGGLSLSYDLKHNMSLLALAHFKQNLSYINSAQNPIQQKNMHFGIGIGLEYKL